MRGADVLVEARRNVPLCQFDSLRQANGLLGIAHAGWSGTIHRVTAATLRCMVEGFGCMLPAMLPRSGRRSDRATTRSGQMWLGRQRPTGRFAAGVMPLEPESRDEGGGG